MTTVLDSNRTHSCATPLPSNRSRLLFALAACRSPPMSPPPHSRATTSLLQRDQPRQCATWLTCAHTDTPQAYLTPKHPTQHSHARGLPVSRRAAQASADVIVLLLILVIVASSEQLALVFHRLTDTAIWHNCRRRCRDGAPSLRMRRVSVASP